MLVKTLATWKELTTSGELIGQKIEVLRGGKTRQGKIVAVRIAGEVWINFRVNDQAEAGEPHLLVFSPDVTLIDDALGGFTFAIPSLHAVVTISPAP